MVAYHIVTLCPIYLPGQNIFCPHKKFYPWLRSSYLHGKRIENDFLAVEKNFPWLKSHFPSILRTNMYSFRLGQNFLSRTKNILSRQMDGAVVVSGWFGKFFWPLKFGKLIRRVVMRSCVTYFIQNYVVDEMWPKTDSNRKSF